MDMKDREQVEREMRGILKFHVGYDQRITRKELVRRVFGNEAAANSTNNNPFDRRIRLVIEKYRDVDLIISSSRADGYWLAESMEEVIQLAEEFDKRSKNMLAKKSKIIKHGQERFGAQLPMFR